MFVKVYIKMKIIRNDKNNVQFQLKNRFISVNLIKKLRIVLKRLFINKFKMFKFWVISTVEKSSKFIFENNTIISRTEMINTNLFKFDFLNAKNIKLSLRQLQTSQFSHDFEKFLQSIEKFVKNALNSCIIIVIN